MVVPSESRWRETKVRGVVLGQAVTGVSQQTEDRVRALSCMNCRPAGIAINHPRIRVVSTLGNKELSVKALYHLQWCRHARGNLSKQRARREKRASPRHIYRELLSQEAIHWKRLWLGWEQSRRRIKGLQQRKTKTQSREAMITLRNNTVNDVVTINTSASIYLCGIAYIPTVYECVLVLMSLKKRNRSSFKKWVHSVVFMTLKNLCTPLNASV